MRHILTIVILATAVCSASAQACYRLYLSDKAGSTTAALSERSMERRARQHIELDSLDLDVSPVYIAQLRQAGLRIVTRSRWLNSVVVAVDDSIEVSGATWDRFPFVTSWQPVVQGEQMTLPRPMRRIRKRIDQTAQPSAAGDDFRTPMLEVNGNVLYDAGHRGRGMLVAVLDGGFNNVNRHEGLNRNVVGCRDMYAPLDTTYIYDSNLADDHGAACMSTMACDSAYGVWGTAVDASYYLIRTEYTDSETPLEEDMWVAGAELADSIGADLISASLGYFMFDNEAYDHSQTQLGTGTVHVTRGAEVAASRGMIVVTAAGNEGKSASAWHALDFPADAPSVLAVAATTSTLGAAIFTSPGFLTPWVKPDVACRGQNSYIILSSTGRPATANGTSFATPTMCGLCASLWSAAPSLTARQIVDIVRQCGSLRDTPTIRLGYGMPDFARALELAMATAAGVDAIERHDLNGRDALDVTSRSTITRAGCYDLHGRPLTAPPAHGLYIDNGRLRSR